MTSNTLKENFVGFYYNFLPVTCQQAGLLLINMYACDRCGKSSQVGMNVSHSHRRTKKRSLPNLHKTTLTIGSKRQTMRLCTKCIRLAKKESAQYFTKKKTTEAFRVETKIKKSGTLSEDIEKAALKEKKEPQEASKVESPV